VARDLAWALANSDLLHDRETLERAIAAMAPAIAEDFRGDVPEVLTVMHGGQTVARRLAMEFGALGDDQQFDNLNATRYRGDTSGGALTWKHRPATPLRGRRVLLVDDILDEGHTLDAITRWCAGEGAEDVRIAALAVKRHDRCVPGVEADYFGVDVPDRYVFGYGMDFQEQGRALPVIRALTDDALAQL
jgi:hypoxanthine phosphoribosyltransferase